MAKLDPEIPSDITQQVENCLSATLIDSFRDRSEMRRERKSILISGNSLSNRFILQKWGIRPSKEKDHKKFFAVVRKHCRTLFESLLIKKRFDWVVDDSPDACGIYKYDDVDGNLILGFVWFPPDSQWKLPQSQDE